MDQELQNVIWVEKYRPRSLEDFVCSESYRKKFQQFIDNKSIDHLLLSGAPGCGKTTMAKILVNSIPCDKLYINASDERNLDMLRNKVKDFAMHISDSGLNICILDEADGLTIQTMAALRPVMEFTAEQTRFILTCNYLQKIIDPIKSRCQLFEFKSFTKEQVVNRLLIILMHENVTYDKKDVVEIATNCYPDIRKAINMLQKSVVDNRLTIDRSVVSQSTNVKILELLKKKDWRSIRKLIAEESVIYEDAYKFLFDEMETINSNPVNLITIAEHSWRNSIASDPEINFMSLVIQLCEEIK